MTEPIKYSYKLVVIGDPSVGKTSLIRRYADKKFDSSYLPTIGADFTIKKIVDQKPDGTPIEIVLAIWDMGGHQKFERIRDHYYLDSNAALIVFDLTRKETYEHVDTWLEDIRSHCENIPCIVLANKKDLPNRTISEDELDRFSSSTKIKVYETSALTGEHVNEIFEVIAKRCLESYDTPG
ncbi:MAG TPA: Rab family GTPase [Candidatus Deferrimicrobium sp.]|nr:Rab family GTPase [Candidatus Deferrimicrobium sp.]